MADALDPTDGLADIAGTDPAEITAYYDTWASAYDADLAQWGYEAPRRVAESLVAAGATSGPVLDAGCGTGLVGAELARLGVTGVVGGDISPASLEVAAGLGVYDELVEIDLTGRLPFDDHRFGGVISVGVFSYVLHPRETIAELLRVCQPGGVVAFTHRIDLWAEQDFDAVLTDVADRHGVDVTVSGPQTYLPGHPEFADDITVRDVLIRRPA